MRRAVLVVALLLAGCAVQPDFKRPEIELPAAWPGGAGAPQARGWSLYGDPQLERLIEEALAANSDLARAVARVDEARALLAQAEAARMPSAGAQFERSRALSSAATGTLPPGVARERNNYRAALEVSYELDLWGRLAAASQAARAELLASEAARDAVRLALAAEVAKTWFALRALDAQVAATRGALALREQGLALQRRRFEGGLISEFELRQLEAEAAAARAQLPALEREREASEAALAVLLGRSPRAILEDRIARAAAPEALVAPVAPAGLPSELLLRRPDLVEAESRLAAANARVALARSAYFPSVQLTGALGSESAALANLFSGPAGIWRFAAAVSAPIFSGGRLEAQVDAAAARERQALAAYQSAIRNAFAEVRTALAAQARAAETFAAESERAAALAAALRLARLRYANGVASQLEVIDAERGLLAAEIARHEALRAQRAALADLYRALGGW